MRIALVPLVRSTFDVAEAIRIFKEQVSFLQKFDKDVQWIFPPEPIEYVETLKSILRAMQKESVDGIVLMSSTFHLGDLALHLSKNFPSTPILCWALPEPPYNGGRVRLNSIVGAHLDFSNLYKSGRNDLTFAYGDMRHDEFKTKLSDWLKALKVIKSLKGSKIGLLGGRAKSFLNVDVYDPELYRALDVLVEPIVFDELFHIPVEREKLKSQMEKYRSLYKLVTSMDEERLEKVARLKIQLEKLFETSRLSALGIRCWPEFATYYGISPCAAMSYNMAEGRIMACEGDVLGALTMLVFKASGCEQTYLADLSQIFESGEVLVWHCGVAAHNLWDERSEKHLDTYFAGGKGVTVGFVLKPGPVTLARLDYIRNRWILLIYETQAVQTEQELKGTYVKISVGNPRKFLETIVESGFAHHVVMAYGSHSSWLKMLSRLKGWEICEPSI